MSNKFCNTHYNLIDMLRLYDMKKWQLAQKLVTSNKDKAHDSYNVLDLSMQMQEWPEMPSLQVCSVFIECALWSYHNDKYGWELGNRLDPVILPKEEVFVGEIKDIDNWK